MPDAAKDYIDNIKLHVYEMQKLPKKVRDCFRSDMRIIVDYLAEGKDYVPTKQKIIHLDALLLMLKALTDDGRYETMISEMQKEENTKGGFTMCELLDRYEAKSRLEDIRNLMETMKWTAEQAMKALKISESDKIKYLAML